MWKLLRWLGAWLVLSGAHLGGVFVLVWASIGCGFQCWDVEPCAVDWTCAVVGGIADTVLFPIVALTSGGPLPDVLEGAIVLGNSAWWGGTVTGLLFVWASVLGAAWRRVRADRPSRPGWSP